MKTVKRKAEVGEQIVSKSTGFVYRVIDIYPSNGMVKGEKVVDGTWFHFNHNEYEVVIEDESGIPPHSSAASEEVALNPILREIHWKIVSQTEKGLKKYGEPVHPDNHSLIEWIDHAVEESIDHITYLLMMKKKIEEGGE